jgi:hypothetical protein
VHFGECESKLFPLGENMFMPAKSSVKVDKGIAEAIQVSDDVMCTDYWTSYDVMKGISHTSAALREVTELCMNCVCC